MKRGAFTLIELMIVVAIIALLAMIAIPNFKRYIARAKRAEAYALLSSLAMAEKTYWAEHGAYSSTLLGSGGIGWKPEGYGGGKPTTLYYSYGFAGSDGTNYIKGSLGAPVSQGHADKDSFEAFAVGDIDGDGEVDILKVDESGQITIVQDDLQ
jgi:prepilin-type N-terminal cleavage/methylation domain-containing protein